MAGKQVKVSVVADTKKFQAAFRGLARESGLNSFTTKMKSVAKIVATATAAVAVSAVAITGKVLAMGADLEQSRGAIQDVFKDAAGQMQDFASKAVTSVGLSGNAYNELATIIGSQLKNAGTPMDQLAGKTNDLITKGADLAAMFGGSTQDAVNALSSALKGERDPIERYGVSLKQAAIDAKAAELGYSKVGGSYDQTAQAAATLALITDQTSDATGKFAREGDTMIHQVQVWKAKLQDFGERVGAAALPPLTALAGELFERVSPALDALGAWIIDTGLPAIQSFASTVASEWVPRLQEAAQWVQTNIVPALVTFGGILTGQVIPAIVQVGTWLTTNAAGFAPLAAFILTLVTAWKAWTTALQIWKVAQLAATAVQAAFNLVLAANPIVLIIIAIAALVAAVVAFLATHEGARKKLAEIWNSIKSSISTAVTGIINFVQGLGTIPVKIAAWFTAAKTRAAAAWNGLVADAKALPGRVVQGLAILGALLGSAVRGHFQRMATGATAGAVALWTFVRSIPNRILSALGNLGSLLSRAGGNVIQGFIDGITGAFGRVRSKLSELTSLLPDWKGPATRDRTILRRPAQLIMGGFIDALRNSYADVEATMAGVTSLVQDGLTPTLKTANTVSGTQLATQRYNGATINVYALTPNAEVGRVVVDAIHQYERLNGEGR